jgi:hypothetical protein
VFAGLNQSGTHTAAEVLGPDVCCVVGSGPAGGSFPMSAVPRGFQTDVLGRLPGWERVHAVDATVFPSIPATTITLSAMANAHWIGWEAARGQGG